jgi:anthranilate synthase component 1
VPEREYEETLDKARALVTAVDRALDGEEMAVAADGGSAGEDGGSAGEDGDARRGQERGEGAQ